MAKIQTELRCVNWPQMVEIYRLQAAGWIFPAQGVLPWAVQRDVGAELSEFSSFQGLFEPQMFGSR